MVAHGCTDDTAFRVRQIQDTRIRVIELPRTQTYKPTLENHWKAGRVAAANAGLNACTGDWIATNDDDDVWMPAHLESLLNAAKRRNLEFISAGSITGKEKIEPYDVDGVKVGGLCTWVYRSYLKSFQFNPQCYRKKWNSVCDTDLQQRFRNAGVKMGYIDDILLTVMPKSDNAEIGLKGARENTGEYLDHLAFQKE